MTFLGLAAPYWQPSRAWCEGHVEEFARGAFRRFTRTTSVELRMNHNPAAVLARQSDGTLRLEEYDSGLYMWARIEDDTWSQLLIGCDRYRLLRGLSVKFSADHHGVEWAHGWRRLVIYDVVSLTEISVCVTYPPRYAATWIARDGEAARLRLIRETGRAMPRELVA